MSHAPDQLADLEEIRRLSYDYTLAIDIGDIDGLLSVFTEDGVLDATATGQERWLGESLREYFSTQQFPAMAHQMHLATNHRIDLHGDTATGTVYYLVFGTSNAGDSVFAGGYHEDEYVRTADGWRFALRRAVPLLVPELAAIGGRGMSK